MRAAWPASAHPHTHTGNHHTLAWSPSHGLPGPPDHEAALVLVNVCLIFRHLQFLRPLSPSLIHCSSSRTFQLSETQGVAASFLDDVRLKEKPVFRTQGRPAGGFSSHRRPSAAGHSRAYLCLDSFSRTPAGQALPSQQHHEACPVYLVHTGSPVEKASRSTCTEHLYQALWLFTCLCED